MVIVVIDDDPATAAALRAALAAAPRPWQVETAAHGVQGLDVVRRMAGRVAAVVLDMHMPHDGVLTAVQLRAAYPTLPIVPCTAYPAHLGVLADLGCAPPVLKDDAATLGAALLVALDAAVTAPPHPASPHPVWAYLREHAQEQERRARARWRAAAQVVVLTSYAWMGRVIAEIVRDAGLDLLAVAPTGDLDRLLAGRTGQQVLLATAECAGSAWDLAARMALPVLLIALEPHHALRMVMRPPRPPAPPSHPSAWGVLALPCPAHVLATAVDAVTASPAQPWQDPRLDAALARAGLAAGDRAIAAMTIAGFSAQEIAAQRGMKDQSVRAARMRIYAATLGQHGAASPPPDDHVAALCRWLDDQVRAMMT